MSNFKDALAYILQNEKGFVDNPNDKGKATNYGISLRFLRNVLPQSLLSYGIYEPVTEQTIKDLTMTQVEAIYKGEFWDHAPFEDIENQDHCNYIFDMAISMGISPAIKCVQRAFWSVIKRRDIIDDGILGKKTLDAIRRAGFLIMPAIRSERAGYYRLVAEKDDNRVFQEGWLNRAYESK